MRWSRAPIGLEVPGTRRGKMAIVVVPITTVLACFATYLSLVRGLCPLLALPLLRVSQLPARRAHVYCASVTQQQNE